MSTQASSAKSALDANNSKANALIELLRRNGVANKDLRTSQLSINPVYNDRSSAITGYQVDNTVQATLRDLGKAGTLLDAAVGTVGNAVRIQQISFSIGDDTALRAQARAQAVAQAKAQAGQLAQAAGVSLGAIRSLTELVDGGSPITYDMGKGGCRDVGGLGAGAGRPAGDHRRGRPGLRHPELAQRSVRQPRLVEIVPSSAISNAS